MNRFIKAMLKILANKPGRSTLDWPKFVRYVALVYNRLSIPGTDVTRFMLRHGGRVPLEPSDWGLGGNRPIQNPPWNEYLVDTVKRFQ